VTNYLKNYWYINDVAPQTFSDDPTQELFQCQSGGVFNVLFDAVRRLNGKVSNLQRRDFVDDGEGGLPASYVSPPVPYSRDKCEQLFKKKIAELRLVEEPTW
jgi:hypothetical protein